MKNSVSDKNLFIESEEEEEEEEDYDDEEATKERIDDADDEESDGLGSSSAGSPWRSRPSSYNTTWPQSYRRSIDMYSSVTPPNLSFVGTPTLSSLISSSFRGKHKPEIVSSLIKPLLPTTAADDQQQRQEERRSSHPLLPPPVQSRKVSFGHAVLNGMNVLCGVGILSTPYAVKEGGWTGLSILLIFAVLAWYTAILLRHCLDSDRDVKTYPDIAQAAFGTTGRIAVSIVIYLELYASCVEYILLESDNLSSLFPNAQLSIGGFHLSSHVLFAVMATVIILPTTWLRDLYLLSYLSAVGVIASILVVLSLIWVGLVDQVGFQNKGTSLNLRGIPIAIGIYGYCYSGHAIYPNIYSSLKKPNLYPRVLGTSFAICTSIFAGAAAIGYCMFGESMQSQFTLNMPHNLVASKVAVWTTVVTPIAKYALTLTPMALSLEELIPANHQKSHIYAIIIRTTLVISTFFVGLAVPFFGLVMALIGSLLTMLSTLILPCACFLSILRGKVTRIQVLLCIVIIAVGIVSSTFGTISALSKIIQNMG